MTCHIWHGTILTSWVIFLVHVIVNVEEAVWVSRESGCKYWIRFTFWHSEESIGFILDAHTSRHLVVNVYLVSTPLDSVSLNERNRIIGKTRVLVVSS